MTASEAVLQHNVKPLPKIILLLTSIRETSTKSSATAETVRI